MGMESTFLVFSLYLCKRLNALEPEKKGLNMERKQTKEQQGRYKPLEDYRKVLELKKGFRW